MTEVWQQYRKIEVGSVSAVADGSKESMDMEINVRNSEKDGLKFDATIWNLNEDTWNSIRKKDPVRITLGWLNGPKSVVCYGKLTGKRTKSKRADTKYILEGVDKSKAQLSARLEHTWHDLQPNEIALDIARRINLSEGKVESVGKTIPGGKSKNYVIRDDRPVSHWLQQLVNEAQKATGTKWEYRANGGKFYFQKKNTPNVEVVTLAYENTLISINQAAEKEDDSKSGPRYTFKALCEPTLSKGSVVQVDTDDVSGAFKVIDLTFKSDTVGGDHIVEGKLAPTGATYAVYYPGKTPPGASGGRSGPTLR